MNDEFSDPATCEARLTRLESLLELAQILGQQGDFSEVLRLVVEKAASLAHAEAALIMMINPRTRNPRVATV